MATKIERLNTNNRVTPLERRRFRDNLFWQMNRMLDNLYSKNCDLTVRERIALLALLYRYDSGQGGDDDRDDAGSAVRQYAAAFRTNAARRRSAAAGREADEFGGDGDGGNEAA